MSSLIKIHDNELEVNEKWEKEKVTNLKRRLWR